MESYFDESKRNAGTPATPCVFSGSSTLFWGEDSELQAVLVANIRARIDALKLMAKNIYNKKPPFGGKNLLIFLILTLSGNRQRCRHTLLPIQYCPQPRISTDYQS
jgi:hypothetical protein